MERKGSHTEEERGNQNDFYSEKIEVYSYIAPMAIASSVALL